MVFSLLDTALMVARTTGRGRTHGAQHGVMLDTSGWSRLHLAPASVALPPRHHTQWSEAPDPLLQPLQLHQPLQLLQPQPQPLLQPQLESTTRHLHVHPTSRPSRSKASMALSAPHLALTPRLALLPQSPPTVAPRPSVSSRPKAPVSQPTVHLCANLPARARGAVALPLPSASLSRAPDFVCTHPTRRSLPSQCSWSQCLPHSRIHGSTRSKWRYIRGRDLIPSSLL